MKGEINAGHGTQSNGRPDCGATYDGHTEKAIIEPVTTSFIKYARAKGIDVYSDMDNGNKKNIVVNVPEANERGSDFYISIHCDWYKAPSGTLPLYYPNSASGYKLAKCLNDAVLAQLDIKTRGIIARSNLYELSGTKMTACIFEIGSIKEDYDLMTKQADLYGKALADGLADYLGIKEVETPIVEKVVVKSEPVVVKKTLILEDGDWGKGTTRRSQEYVNTYVDGIVSNQMASCKKYLISASGGWEFGYYNKDGSTMIKAIQKLIGVPFWKRDGVAGKKFVTYLQRFLNKKGYKLVVDGYMGENTVKAWQNFLNR